MAQAFFEDTMPTLLEPLAPTFWDIAPEEQGPPFIVLTRVSSVPWRSINGPSGITQTSLQVDIYAVLPIPKARLVRSVRQKLDGYRGMVTTGSDSQKINGISLQNSLSFGVEETDPDLYRELMTFLITHEET